MCFLFLYYMFLTKGHIRNSFIDNVHLEFLKSNYIIPVKYLQSHLS